MGYLNRMPTNKLKALSVSSLDDQVHHFHDLATDRLSLEPLRHCQDWQHGKVFRLLRQRHTTASTSSSVLGRALQPEPLAVVGLSVDVLPPPGGRGENNTIGDPGLEHGLPQPHAHEQVRSTYRSLLR